MYHEYALVTTLTSFPHTHLTYSSAIVTLIEIYFERRNTQIEDTCVVFRGWHISSKFTFFLSFLAVIAISLAYEWLRAYSRAVDQRIALGLAKSSKGKDRTFSSGRSSPEVLNAGEVEEAGLLSGKRKAKAG